MECLQVMHSLCSSSLRIQFCLCLKGENQPIKLIINLHILLLCRLHHNSTFEKIFRGLVVSACVLDTALVCYGRVYLLYHTVNQVLIGALIGTLTGFVWFFFVHSILTPYVFPKIVSWKISEALLIRDTSLIPNILFFEYTATRQESRARLRKSFQKMQ